MNLQQSKQVLLDQLMILSQSMLCQLMLVHKNTWLIEMSASFWPNWSASTFPKNFWIWFCSEFCWICSDIPFSYNIGQKQFAEDTCSKSTHWRFSTFYEICDWSYLLYCQKLIYSDDLYNYSKTDKIQDSFALPLKLGSF